MNLEMLVLNVVIEIIFFVLSVGPPICFLALYFKKKNTPRIRRQLVKLLTFYFYLMLNLFMSTIGASSSIEPPKLFAYITLLLVPFGVFFPLFKNKLTRNDIFIYSLKVTIVMIAMLLLYYYVWLNYGYSAFMYYGRVPAYFVFVTLLYIFMLVPFGVFFPAFKNKINMKDIFVCSFKVTITVAAALFLFGSIFGDMTYSFMPFEDAALMIFCIFIGAMLGVQIGYMILRKLENKIFSIFSRKELCEGKCEIKK